MRSTVLATRNGLPNGDLPRWAREMNSKSYGVTVVVDPHFGARLRDLPADEPAWVVDSEENHPAIQSFWQDRKTCHPDGITSFKFDVSATPEDWLISQLGTIDLHHGEFSHNPPWSVLKVIGIPWSERIAHELDRFGFRHHADTPLGFEANKASEPTLREVQRRRWTKNIIDNVLHM